MVDYIITGSVMCDIIEYLTDETNDELRFKIFDELKIVKSRTLEAELRKEREKVMDEFEILRGEDAKKLYDYMRS